LPKEVMAFPDFPFKKSKQSFVTHTEVLQYLEHYCLHFNLEQFIRYRTTVKLVEPIVKDGVEKWQVISSRDQCQTPISEIYDAVIVCNGHYSDPFIPEIPDMASFRGEIDHSHNYRVNSRFAGKTVAFLGAHASGMDIAIETAEVADQVYLCTRYPEKIKSDLPSNMKFVPAFDSMWEGGICLPHGERLPVDVVIFCTGYNFTFPFLSPKVRVDVTPHRVKPLYKHVVSINHPTLSFLGLCSLVCPFPQFDLQATFVSKILKGTFQLPTTEEMLKDEAKELDYRMKELGWPERHAHRMNNLQWAYNDELAELGSFPPLPKVYQELYEYVWKRRTFDVLGYRRDNYEVCDDDNFRLISSSG